MADTSPEHRLERFLCYGNDSEDLHVPVDIVKFREVIHQRIKDRTVVKNIQMGDDEIVQVVSVMGGEGGASMLNENMFIIAPALRYDHRYCNKGEFENHIFTGGMNKGEYIDCMTRNHFLSVCRFSSDHINYTPDECTPVDMFVMNGEESTPDNTYVGYFVEPMDFKSHLDPTKELVYCVQSQAALIKKLSKALEIVTDLPE